MRESIYVHIMILDWDAPGAHGMANRKALRRRPTSSTCETHRRATSSELLLDSRAWESTLLVFNSGGHVLGLVRSDSRVGVSSETRRDKAPGPGASLERPRKWLSQATRISRS